MFEKIKKFNYKYSEKIRFNNTIKFIKKTLPKNSNILDIGVHNRLSERMINEGYNIANTNGDDLDLFPINHKTENFDAITAFEILEHLLSPFELLRSIKSKKLYASVPLNLWYSKAYRHPNDERAWHFHEFEDWQFDWLLKKSGWKVIRREKWVNPSFIPGIRTILRNITKRYYVIEAIRE